jgi:Family of unknown function (DUF6502)
MLALKILVPLLMPIATLCLKRGVKVQEFLEAAKRAFVQAAQRELENQAQKENTSRIALMTGLQRNDVNRIQRLPTPPAHAINLTTRIIGHWCNNRSFSLRGQPKALTFKGGPVSFTKLVTSISKDVNPSTVLFELERLGAVVRGPHGIELVARGYSPTTEDHDKDALQLLVADISDLTSGVESNIAANEVVPNLHITTRYDNINPDAIPQIRSWLLKKGSAFQAEVRSYLSKFDKDLNPALFASRGGARVSLGTFSFTVSAKPTNGEQEDVVE